jgi:hypothetical protein
MALTDDPASLGLSMPLQGSSVPSPAPNPMQDMIRKALLQRLLSGGGMGMQPPPPMLGQPQMPQPNPPPTMIPGTGGRY